VTAAGGFQRSAGGLQFLQAEQRDAEIGLGQREIRIGGQSLLKIFLPGAGLLLIHVGDAQ